MNPLQRQPEAQKNCRYWGVASLCFAAFATCGALVLGSWFLCSLAQRVDSVFGLFGLARLEFGVLGLRG